MSEIEKYDLLVEIGTEELPPKALTKLNNALAQGIVDGLQAANLKIGVIKKFATPRRLAVLINDVPTMQADQQQQRRGPAISAAFDQNGNPSKAALGFAKSCNVTVDELQTLKTEKGSWLVYNSRLAGQALCDLLPAIVEQSLNTLPIPKRMRWADRSDEFVRPVRWVLLLHGQNLINADILGIQSGNCTYGHRFHHPEPIIITEPQLYAELLYTTGKVIADVEQRRTTIRNQAEQLATQTNGITRINDELLDEVTALVEWPVAVLGDFESRFLDIPAEVLITTMQDNQKYFPIIDTQGNLLPHFITIANVESRDIAVVREGNERVIRPRFSDAEFFWQQDLKQDLDSHLGALQNMVFQKRLGSLADKCNRVTQLARVIVDSMGGNIEWVQRAATLSKCDLLTNMVQEFPELQGVMGRYYAEYANEPSEVATALAEQYLPRFAGDSLPETTTGRALAIADRIDTLVGIFAIGQKPSGNRDPFALRRAALGVLRILIESQWDLDLLLLLQQAAAGFSDDISAEQCIDNVFDFMIERLRGYYHDQELKIDTFDAVHACSPKRPLDFENRVRAVTSFRTLPQAKSLAAANKRIRNILRRTEGYSETQVSEEFLTEPAEQILAREVNVLQGKVMPLFVKGDYISALTELAALREPVDRFFDDVMVMVDDNQIRNNRLALLDQLSDLFLQVADFSKLQT